jgi:hypothetical protein
LITETVPVFPNNIVSSVSLRLGLIDSDLFVTQRPLRQTDPVQSIGVFGAIWSPEQESNEMRGIFRGGEPTLSRYVVTVQAFVRDMDEVRGLATHSVLSAIVRGIIYRDQPLRDLLGSLETEVEGVKERVTRWGITAQRFLNNELQAEWLYLSSLELWVQTEIN